MSDSSIFFSKARRFNLSLMAVEVYAAESVKAVSDDELMDVIVIVLHQHCGVDKPDQDDFNYFLERLQEVKSEVDSNLAQQKDKPKTKPSFGTSYLEYMNGLNIDSTLMQMTGYNYANAQGIYTQLDRADALRLIGEYKFEKIQQNNVRMESVLYGMGGKYKDDAGSGHSSNDGVIERVHDINSESGLKRLRELGF